MRRPAGAALVLTILWLVGCAWYVSANIGWEALSTFLPHELGTFCAGVFASPAFLWLLVAYLRRGADFDEAVGQIRQGMSRLTYPVDEATDRVESISEALSRQADMLSAATDKAAEQAALLREVLEDHTSRLKKASANAADRVREMTAGMRHQLQDLTDACLAPAREVAEPIDTPKEESNQIGGTATVAEERIRAIGDMFHTRSEELAKTSEAAFEQVSRVGETLQNQRVSLTSALTEASEKASEVGNVFSRQA